MTHTFFEIYITTIFFVKRYLPRSV